MCVCVSLYCLYTFFGADYMLMYRYRQSTLSTFYTFLQQINFHINSITGSPVPMTQSFGEYETNASHCLALSTCLLSRAVCHMHSRFAPSDLNRYAFEFIYVLFYFCLFEKREFIVAVRYPFTEFVELSRLYRGLCTENISTFLDSVRCVCMDCGNASKP